MHRDTSCQLLCAKILQKIIAPSLSVNKIVKYCGRNYNTYKQNNCILPVTTVLRHFLKIVIIIHMPPKPIVLAATLALFLCKKRAFQIKI